MRLGETPLAAALETPCTSLTLSFASSLENSTSSFIQELQDQ